jgi:hypothetical protein
LNRDTRLAHLLLGHGADPYYQLSRKGSDSKNPRFSPVIQLLENFNLDFNDHYKHVFMGLLEECKKSKKIVLDDFKQWAGNNIDWIGHPQLCQFLIENGVDPLMNCMESYPFKYALGATFDMYNSLWSPEVGQCVRIMLPYCRDRLEPSQLELKLPQSFYHKSEPTRDIFWLLLEQGFTCKEWAQNDTCWLVDSKLCELLLKNGSVDPFIKYPNNNDSEKDFTIFDKVWSSLSSNNFTMIPEETLKAMLPYCSE